jgi:hypothetical protein
MSRCYMKTILFIWAFLILICVGLVANHAMAQPIITDSTSKSETTVKSPPPSAISPNITIINNDICTTAASGAVQTQIFGFSTGFTVTDKNCELLKLSKNLYDMGMKTAAVANLCRDVRVWESMWNSGTYCPYDGKVGTEARDLWLANPDKIPKE